MIHTLTACEIKDKFLKGDLTALAVTEAFLKRIDQYDSQIGAFLAVYKERAIEKAKQLDKKRALGEKLGKLAAVPMAIKDNIHIKEEISTCASKFLVNYRAPFDATVVRLLEEEDAILLGKTNMDEFAMGSSNESSALQKTYNPWNLKCTPGGSSGGSAAAVAGRLCPLALGSDTGGSIRLPASFCGVVGFKPTYGRVSRYGLVAYASSLDQIGPFATNTRDAALVMEVIGKHCDKDSTSLPAEADDYLTKMNKDIKGKKIGVPWHFLDTLAAEPKKVFNNSLEILKSLGAEIVEIDLSILKYSLPVYYILATAEASTNLARFDGVRYGHRSSRAQTLDEIYDFSKSEGFGEEVKQRILLGTFVLSSGYQQAYYKKAQKIRTLIIQSYQEAFKRCDLVASPVSPFAAFEIGSIKDPIQMYLEDIYTIGINLAGLPAISIPAGFSAEGKPMGLQLIGPQKDEVGVFQVSHAFEKATSYHMHMPELVK
ncbi:Glutamyl-tRNA(Gln) amidotransferase subunit A [Neochlamydia sp. AcF65]|uniref:Asp-tRNA(Asn)/Glu-tRNA(Gln) amidotransferase subunit GatA n=1 Tax=Neochlamydia sp. AcF65 TaxID=2795735 RepID=UPI001BD80CA8|nr:Asp-tRNA(Asn)/Glu-tRNA(Gln) amidotransferase subunit GatA [Neochlamydia sp. AcF65]MBS4165621.1 Glutamyl-tRNA(Gln) amidotransferase subunit A [Neochlamydia sp. AcF65]